MLQIIEVKDSHISELEPTNGFISIESKPLIISYFFVNTLLDIVL